MGQFVWFVNKAERVVHRCSLLTATSSVVKVRRYGQTRQFRRVSGYGIWFDSEAEAVTYLYEWLRQQRVELAEVLKRIDRSLSVENPVHEIPAESVQPAGEILLSDKEEKK